MAVAKGKTRVTITLHEETIKLLNELSALHDDKNLSTSNLIEISILFYAQACLKQIDSLKEKEHN